MINSLLAVVTVPKLPDILKQQQRLPESDGHFKYELANWSCRIGGEMLIYANDLCKSLGYGIIFGKNWGTGDSAAQPTVTTLQCDLSRVSGVTLLLDA